MKKAKNLPLYFCTELLCNQPVEIKNCEFVHVDRTITHDVGIISATFDPPEEGTKTVVQDEKFYCAYPGCGIFVYETTTRGVWKHAFNGQYEMADHDASPLMFDGEGLTPESELPEGAGDAWETIGTLINGLSLLNVDGGIPEFVKISNKGLSFTVELDDLDPSFIDVLLGVPRKSVEEVKEQTTQKTAAEANEGGNTNWGLQAGETRVTNATTGASKGSKDARFDLIPVLALTELAKLYGFGVKKYAARNWEAGYNLSLSYAALQRHANAWWGGEDTDEETSLSHMAAVAWHAFTLFTLLQTHPEMDDRPTTTTNN